MMYKSLLKKLGLIVVVVALVFSASQSAWGGFRDGLDAYKRGDYATALKEWRPLAEQGNAKAQYFLGRMYEMGWGVPKDYKLAVKWFRKSAKQGNAKGQNSLGAMYHIGRGVPQDYKLAVKWYRRSAEQGDAKTQFSLGLLYDAGIGVPKDYKLAVKWFRKSADQGHANAQSFLGWMYEKGRGVPKDDKLAVKWYRKSAEQGHAYAQINLVSLEKRKREERQKRLARLEEENKRKEKQSRLEKERARKKIVRKPSPQSIEEIWKPEGSGIYLKGSVHILTNLHVVSTAKRIRVSFPSGESYSAKIIARDANNDVAIIALKGMSPRENGFHVDRDLEIDPGMEVHAIGYPLDSGISIVSGNISSSTGMRGNVTKFTMTAPINEGNSGGPVIDENGNLIGIAQGGFVRRGVENVRFGTKIATTVFALKQAKLSRQFSIQVKRRKRKFSSREIFKKFSPYVVRIDVK